MYMRSSVRAEHHLGGHLALIGFAIFLRPSPNGRHPLAFPGVAPRLNSAELLIPRSCWPGGSSTLAHGLAQAEAARWSLTACSAVTLPARRAA